MRGVTWLICASFLFLSGALEAGTLKWEKWYDDRKFFVDYTAANSPFGETIQSMIKRKGAEAGINFTFFGRIRKGNKKGFLFPIGRVGYRLEDFTVCPAPHGRGYLWQVDKPCIAFEPYCGKSVFIAQGGVILVLKGEIVKDLQKLPCSFWNRKCLRSVIALNEKNHRFYLMKIYGSLWDMAKYLKKRGMTSAVSLDGGSSSQSSAKVVNGLLVFSKEKAFYRQFSSAYFGNSLFSNWRVGLGNNNISIRTSLPACVDNCFKTPLFFWEGLD